MAMMKSSSATRTAAALTVLVLAAVSATAAADSGGEGGLIQKKDERNECFLLCIYDRLCTCNLKDPTQRISCCEGYCWNKCGKENFCGDLPKKPCH